MKGLKKMDNSMKFEFPAKSENERFARTVCAAFVVQLDPTLEELDEIKTAISEAVTNSIIHGYENSEGIIEISGQIKDNIVKYIIKDKGCGIDNVEKAMEPLYTGKPESERSGMGFSIMEAFMDGLEVESTKGKGTTVIMTKRISNNE